MEVGRPRLNEVMVECLYDGKQCFFKQKIEYKDPPVRCGSCGTFGHRVRECPQFANATKVSEMGNVINSTVDNRENQSGKHPSPNQIRPDLGRWADVEDEGNGDEETDFDGNVMVGLIEEGHDVAAHARTYPMVQTTNQPTVQLEIPLTVENIPMDLMNKLADLVVEGNNAINTNTCAGRSFITTSPGRVEMVYNDVMAVDAALTEQGGDFLEVGKHPPSRTAGRGKKQGDPTSALETRNAHLETLPQKGK
ncbi:hypothetical protein NE237_002252 [Protea cynaroides]|uniref:CCHC-type domain-containing protein n=1 Tax=Protea cynaroides TaxID=273540 RepID=A0A9Q0KVJ1_9MAGN|nr:hypothetical protein NE237_002252 [Protea cynaroides]